VNVDKMKRVLHIDVSICCDRYNHVRSDLTDVLEDVCSTVHWNTIALSEIKFNCF